MSEEQNKSQLQIRKKAEAFLTCSNRKQIKVCKQPTSTQRGTKSFWASPAEIKANKGLCKLQTNTSRGKSNYIWKESRSLLGLFK